MTTLIIVYTGLRCLSETPEVVNLRKTIEQGKWSKARNELEEMRFESGEIGKARYLAIIPLYEYYNYLPFLVNRIVDSSCP